MLHLTIVHAILGIIWLWMLFYTSVEINPHKCSTPPYLPLSLKGKGGNTLSYKFSEYSLIKSRPQMLSSLKLCKPKEESTLNVLAYCIDLFSIQCIFSDIYWFHQYKVCWSFFHLWEHLYSMKLSSWQHISKIMDR